MAVRLSDTLPVQVEYLGPLTYTSGSGGYASGVITWSGTIHTATAVLVAWPVRVALDVPYGSAITNTATVSDAHGSFETAPAVVLLPRQAYEIYLPAIAKHYP